MILAGAAGGVINAVLTQNRNWLPLRTGGVRSVIRPGLALCVAIGAAAVLLAGYTLASLSDGAGARLAVPRVIAGGIFVGVLAANTLSSFAAVRMLRAALVCVASAPAAPPEFVDALRAASPAAALEAVQRLALGPRRTVHS